MIIGCTKNLLEFLKVTPTKREGEIDPLFSWTANLITVNRRKALVAVNDAAKCCFVLYGLTAKILPKLPELILSGIRAVLESEYIAPEVIEKYLKEAGSDVVWTPTVRSGIAYCNKACERVKRFSNLLDADELIPGRFFPWMNDDMIMKHGGHTICEILCEVLAERYGSPVQSARMAELEIELALHTPCKRTLLVPDNFNFYQLHTVLQTAFAWEDCHLHQFVLKKNRSEKPEALIRPDYVEMDDLMFVPDIKRIDSTEITVKEVFSQYKKIEYEYDFGDEWVHTVKLKRWIENCDSPMPTCTEAVGETPLENSGGPSGFQMKAEILADPEHPDYEDIVMWSGGRCTNPLNTKAINWELGFRYRHCIPVIYD